MTHHKPRRLWLAAHLYLGLGIGGFYMLAGITGSLLAFYVEIDRALNPALVIAASPPVKSYEQVLQVLQQQYPERERAWRLEIPVSSDRPVMARYYKPVEKSHLAFAPLVVAVNPYTLQVINSRFWGEHAMTWIYDLHYTLLLDRTGHTLMALVGMLMLLSLCSGLYLWWPRGRSWNKALGIKLRHGRARWIYDLHTLTGAYAMVVVLTISVTGIVLAKPDWFNPLINRASPTFETPDVWSEPSEAVKRISMDDALRIAQQQFPQAEPRWLESPDGEEGVFMVRLHQPGEPGNRFPKTTVWIEQYSGEVLAVRNPFEGSAGDAFLDWQHPLHSGEAFGLVGRILVLLSGLVLPVLLVTGTVRWRQKIKARQRVNS